MRLVFSPETYNLGETTRMIKVASAAVDRGHHVHFHAYADKYSSLVTQAGLPLDLSEPRMSQAEADQIMALDQGRGMRHPFSVNIVRQRVSAELAVLKEADAVIIGSNPTMFLSARIAGVPLFYVRPWFLSRSHLLNIKDRHRVSPLMRLILHAVRWRPRSFALVAREYGLKLPTRTVDLIMSDVDLITSLFPCLDGRPIDSRDRVVGPIYWQPDVPLPDFVQNRSKDRPLIYVGMGSSGSPRVLWKVLKGLSGMNVDVLVSGVVDLPDASFTRLGPNFHRAEVVPEHLLRGHVSAAITHGGEGTLQAICQAGIPFAAHPMQAEQRWNIEECVRAEVAVRLRRSDLRPEGIQNIVGQLLRDESLSARASTLADQVSALQGSFEAVRVIESVLENTDRTFT